MRFMKCTEMWLSLALCSVCRLVPKNQAGLHFLTLVAPAGFSLGPYFIPMTATSMPVRGEQLQPLLCSGQPREHSVGERNMPKRPGSQGKTETHCETIYKPVNTASQGNHLHSHQIVYYLAI